MKSVRTLSVAPSLLCLLLVAGCGGQAITPTAQPGAVSPVATDTGTLNGTLTVFAAASLKDAFDAMVNGLKEKGMSDVTYNYAGSQALVAQLGQGAKADVFASADAKSMEAAIVAGAVMSGTQQVLATNKLVVITARGDTPKVTTLKDLAKPGIKLDLAGPSVPAGNYALQALDKLSSDPAYGSDFKARALANVVSREDNVRQVLSKVQLGEADAGIVYATDAKAKPMPGRIMRPVPLGVGTIEIPDQYNVTALYYIAPVKDAPHPQAAKGFIEYVLSGEGQQVLASYGFGRAVQSK